MRSLLSFGNKKSGKDKSEGKAVNSPESPQDERSNSIAGTTNMFRTFFGRSASFGESPGEDKSRLSDITARWVHSASSTLSSSIEEILGDSAALSGENMSGFKKLLLILENEDVEIHTEEAAASPSSSSSGSPVKRGHDVATGGHIVERSAERRIDEEDDVDRWEKDTGEGCIQVLLDNINHPRFVEICNENNLVVSLVHAMRLLKILEIKAAKVVSSSLNPDGSVMSGHSVSASHLQESRNMMGCTLVSAQRVCTLLEVLCCDPHTMELLNNHKSL